jgi:aspartate-semialdehyde dehydrogenase
MNPSFAIVGVTGLVGRTMLKVLAERHIPMRSLRAFASSASAGRELPFADRTVVVEPLDAGTFNDVDFALFSAGSSISREFAPIAAKAGAIVVDNSSAWRMDPNVPLVVPEVNPGALSRHNGIIANPNCSTIQLVVALKPLHDAFGLKRVVVSTYQSISGAGQSGLDQLHQELAGDTPAEPKFSRPAAFNTIFHSFPPGDDQTEEETKMVNETKKILDLPELAISVTCVRIPTVAAHGESVNIEFDRPVTAEQAREILAASDGIVVMDDPASDVYPTPLDAGGRDEVFVGRIRADESRENTLNLWVVADNVRKGAATNAVQIVEKLLAPTYASP